jgi:two-component system, OmpR family, sensor histidine kinase BaeS
MDDRLGLLTHELRSPVAALVAIAETVAERGGELDSRMLRRLLRLAVAAARDVERIVADAAPTSLRPEPVDPTRLVVDAVAAARLSGAAIRVEMEPGLPTVEADPVRLRQALGNLIDNALAHSPAGREIVVSARSAGDGVELAVADEGEGISPAEQQAIFQPGVRFADRPGEGIGLAVARAVAEAHGGRIAVESSAGAGATFRLVLPLAAGRG